MLEELIQSWDGETTIIRHDQKTNSWIVIAIHSTMLGPAMGGTRMRPYESPAHALRDAHRLASAMTRKYAVHNLPHGGGKAVIAIPETLNENDRIGLFHLYGKTLGQLGGLFSCGPDIGTGPEEMNIIAATGSPHVFCRTPDAGGAGSSGPITAVGVFAGLQTAAKQVFRVDSLQGVRVLVQGVGSVGEVLIRLLQQQGAIVSFSDVNDGLITRFRDEEGLPFVPPEQVFKDECDILSPNAIGGILNTDTIPQLQCRLIVGGANNQLASADDANRLHRRGIIFIPDYVVSVGAVMAIPGIERDGWTVTEAEQKVTERVGATVTSILQLAAAKEITPHAAAETLVRERLSPR